MNEENWIEKRNRSCLDFVKLAKTVRDSFSIAVKKGYHPTEVWLGEAEARILMVELHLQSFFSLFPRSGDVSEIINESVDGVRLMGLRVRSMAGNGVRVGVSFSTEENT